jgi:hypothetical protein
MIDSIVHARIFSARRVVRLLAVLLLMVFPAFAAAQPAADDPPLPPAPRDLGDAPDSTNHFGAAMAAYPGVPANFPTVFDPALGAPQGPAHFAPKADSWLGANVSAENDADLLPDADGVRNIIPPANDPNNDWFDDGVFPVNPNGLALPQCQLTNFNYIVTGAAGVNPHPARVNVWIDFNSDGDWADTLNCATPAGVVNVPEWAVQNQVVMVNPGSQVFVTPQFRSFHPWGPAPTWMRITLAGQPAPLSPAGVADGRGPAGGYQIGETEDYYLTPFQAPGGGIAYHNGDD